MSDGESKKQGLAVRGDEIDFKPLYANTTTFNASENEFAFSFLFASGEVAHLLARVVMSPKHAIDFAQRILGVVEEMKAARGQADETAPWPSPTKE